ncbi:toprim domain-containing protein [Salipiger sp. 1_MG-2023]|uniref:toprim domain-containing protein n=1 Tax=Salipiger sp. 1_MG-2023 TaxID=3062665 RepID=UPI0026E2F2BC|nr:toprim domain-containing protein [Salipiger sp. 1_MG-2023]MDO6588293.1 toprim domain-containing protein [Salipiger sp. 1_MG-2023]
MDAKEITLALRGRWYRSYGLAFCPAHGNTRTPALSLGNGTDGRLLARCHAGCEFRDIVDALRGLGIVDGGGGYSPPDPDTLAKREAEARADADRRERQALAIWREGLPISGTLAERYLRGRGLTCPLPDTLRFHPSCWHSSAKRFPAMLARVDGAARFALHRTYLCPDGTGKAAVAPSKAMLGAVKGGAVRLSDAEGPLVLAEGIETGLALLSGLLQLPVRLWACLSASGMQRVTLPPDPGRLTIATDSDDSGVGKAAGDALALRASSLGWTVSLLPAPKGRDWADILALKGGAK